MAALQLSGQVVADFRQFCSKRGHLCGGSRSKCWQSAPAPRLSGGNVPHPDAEARKRGGTGAGVQRRAAGVVPRCDWRMFFTRERDAGWSSANSPAGAGFCDRSYGLWGIRVM